MLGPDHKQNELFSYTTLEQRSTTDYPLLLLRELVDSILAAMDQDFDGLYSMLGRASIAPERLLRALSLQVTPSLGLSVYILICLGSLSGWWRGSHV